MTQSIEKMVFTREDEYGGTHSEFASRVEKILSHFNQKQMKEREKKGWGWVRAELLAPLSRFMFPLFFPGQFERD